jgi:predicted deacylase
VEDVCNLAGLPAVTCEVLSPVGSVATGSVDRSYNQMLAFLSYFGII